MNIGVEVFFRNNQIKQGWQHSLKWSVSNLIVSKKNINTYRVSELEKILFGSFCIDFYVDFSQSVA